MTKLILDLNKSLGQNASLYFDKAKKMKKKLKGAEEALSKSIKELEKLERKKEKFDIAEKEKEKLRQRKQEWYEKFRWFRSSEGFLIIGGRDATSNEIVIKKHAEKNDLVFHTDMTGSPFFVIKTEGKKPGEKTIHEAADATITFSRAFKLNMTTTPTFMAKPEQLTKEAKSGEFVPKGGFVTTGKLEYIDNKINLAVGMTKENAVMSGPLEAVKKHCEKFVQLQQGNDKVSKAAKYIQYKLGGNLDDIIRALPAGSFKIVK
jgi:predicted ribosome quality control (RQC) complex YloA/Tae2 family protein|tara:strand:- start:1134 stop:1919 length:786 start_codon:yes stop_codon:yes gene_type:complete